MNRSLFKKILTGVKKGLTTPNLPDNILKLQLHPIIRILRFVGGVCTLLLISSRVLLYPFPMIVYVFALFISIIYLIYNIYITYHRIKHVYYILKSDKLEVKSSSLDNNTSLNVFIFKENKIFNWERLLLVLLIIMVVIYKTNLISLNNLILLVNITYEIFYTTKYSKHLALVLMVVSLVLIIRYIIIILIIYLFKNQKISNSIFLPSFLRKNLDVLESMSKSKGLPLIIDFYYKHMYLYIFCLLFSLFDYFFIVK